MSINFFCVYAFTLLLLFSNNSCTVNNRSGNEVKKVGENKNGLKIGKWTYKYKIDNRDVVDSLYWDIVKNDSVKVNVPKNWHRLNSNDYVYYAFPNKKDSNQYFVILSQKVGIDLKDYIKISYKALLEDEQSAFEYWLMKFNFKNKKAYYSICYTKSNYKLYTFFYEKNNYIYDFSFKVQKDLTEENPMNYFIFMDIVRGYKENDMFLIPEKEIIYSIDTIEFQNL